MAQSNRHFRGVFGVGWACFAVSVPVVHAAGVAPRAVISLGEVSADNVYVRSGPSVNHYTICKLHAGDRVQILAERGEWYEVLPPKGAFSLIAGEYVDTADNKAGVVNGNRVRVRAGSQLNKSKYTVQTMLSKGAEVTILGEEPDGFLRIVPPTGATLWINSGYVEMVPDELVELQHKSDPAVRVDTGGADAREEAGVTDKQAAGTPTVKTAAAGESDARRSPFSGLPKTEQRLELEKIDLAAENELQKPLLDRDLAHLLKRYNVIAEQDQDKVAKRYARLRCTQITRMQEDIDLVKRLRSRSERADAKRREYLAKRMQLPRMSPPVPDGLDAQGELRLSALYPPGRKPQRYRLVDPTGSAARTVGYVEIPLDSPINAREYLGRYVGVRASMTRLQSGGVDPVPIYVASELVLVAPAGVAAKNRQE